MVSKYDNILIGLLVALAVGAIGFALTDQAVSFANRIMEVNMEFRTRSMALIGICLNVIPMNYFRKRYWNKSLRGLVIGTFILAVVWFVYFGQDLLKGAGS